MDVTVVIRSSGERTERFCQHIIEKQLTGNNVFVINERPFWKAVKRTFEIGLSCGRKWTLAVDADVILSKSSIERMIEKAELIDFKLFAFQGYVYDKIFDKAREGGPHLYRTSALNDALTCLESNKDSLRPESDTYKALAKIGYTSKVVPEIFGWHDFFQFNSDYYRKAFLCAKKRSFNSEVVNVWIDKVYHQKDNDGIYSILVSGWLEGMRSDEVKVDIEWLNNKVPNWIKIDDSDTKIDNRFEEFYDELELINTDSIVLRTKLYSSQLKNESKTNVRGVRGHLKAVLKKVLNQ